MALAAALAVAAAAGAVPQEVTVSVDWIGPPVATSRTAATVEVDVMPFLGRTDFGGPFDAYYEALSNLGSEFVRYAPWYPNPRVVVPELTPPDCTSTKPATNWNSTLFDGIVFDFMRAVCGPDAVRGACAKSVVQQLSTMPSWMYEGGYCPNASTDCLPANPWNTTNPFSRYTAGGALVDKTCGQMARYMARVVGWYTAGGFHDECGHWHASGYNFSWWGLSVLNEDEHRIQPDNGEAYTMCYDAIVTEVAKVNPAIVPVGPEIAGNLDYLLYFLDPSHHKNGVKPRVSSYHQAMFASNDSAAAFFTQWDRILETYVQPVEAFNKKVGSDVEMVLNEFIPFQNDWCDCEGVAELCGGKRFPTSCPNWQDPATAGGDPNLQHRAGVGMNKATWSYHAAGGVFAYGYGTLAELGYKYVGQDQLIGGTWPDNEPGVSCLDWQTGQPNAKYWVTNLLATTLGDSQPKTVYNRTVSAASVEPPPAPGTTGKGTCGDTTYIDDCTTSTSGAWNTTTHNITMLQDCVRAVSSKCGPNGNYASFSLENNDCSWYRECDMGHLDVVGRGYVSQVIHPFTPPGGTGAGLLYALPYRHRGARGLLLVSKVPQPLAVTLGGETQGVATVIEVTPGDPTTALNPPVTRSVAPSGGLTLGPFAVAVVSQLD